MKNRILSAVLLLLLAFTAKAQVFDGITQPTRWRVWLPVSVLTHESSDINSTPFIGFKQDIGERFSVTPVLQYNIKAEAFVPQVWLNFNVAKKFYILSRSIYDTKADLYKHTLSATYKLPLGFMVDATWENLYNGKKFADGDRLQFVGGIAYWKLVANAGYSCRTAKGFIANLRIKFTDWNWLQLKYDGGLKQVQAAMAIQFN